MRDSNRLPGDDTLVIHFAHVAYRLAERFALRETGIEHFQTWNRDDTRDRIAEGHVLVLSGLWSDDMLVDAANLSLIQVCAAGYDRFGLDALRARGVRLANGSGVNRNAVSDHAMALLLALARQVHTGRDRQREHVWRGMISDLGRREEELAGKTMLIYGLGSIGSRLAHLARAFDMTAIGIKRDVANHDGSADEVRSPDRFLESAGRGGRGGAHVPAHGADGETRRRECAGADEARRVSDQRRARGMRQRAGSRRGPRTRRDRRCRHRHHPGGAAGPRLAAVGHRERVDHAPHRWRDPAVRRQRGGYPDREYPAVAAGRRNPRQRDCLMEGA